MATDKFKEVELPEPYVPIDWEKFKNRVFGFDEWIAKNRKRFEQKYGKNTR